ncbi:MAG: glycerol-3-phosphate 1-O-acyltransferase PlsY [Erysipelotrichaceae bacterium]|nr:glycerol-3-phosphate 1-O-acyltransferase PlsY [Erysipelotrichaceae bacterium]
MNYVISAVLGYLIGSVSFSYIISKYHGFDIRSKGSGNAGASNITVTLGWKFGVLTALLDIFKGFAAFKLAQMLFPALPLAPYVAGCCAVLGHIFPFYMNFKGGKGFATYTGMILAIDWRIVVVIVIASVIITLVTNYIALATLTTAIGCPIYFWIAHYDPLIIAMFVVLMIVMICKHWINIQRIIKGEEIGLRKMKDHRVEKV